MYMYICIKRGEDDDLRFAHVNLEGADLLYYVYMYIYLHIHT